MTRIALRTMLVLDLAAAGFYALTGRDGLVVAAFIAALCILAALELGDRDRGRR